MDIAAFRERPLLGIARGVRSEAIGPLVEASVEAGLPAIEITMNTPGAPARIAETVLAAEGRIAVGAGTVLTVEQARTAVDAGATFIVLPILVEPVVRWCRDHRVPVFPGALTPKEIWDAWEAGATMVKLFPAARLGPDYVAEIKAPLDAVELLVCGGVTPDNVGAFFRAGASAAAFGSSVYRPGWIQSGQYDEIVRAIRTFLRAIS